MMLPVHNLKYLRGYIYLCYEESEKVKPISGKTKIPLSSILDSGKVGTTCRLYFNEGLKYGDFKEVVLEVLSSEYLDRNLQIYKPLLLALSKESPYGLFTFLEVVEKSTLKEFKSL